jgi:osmotically inducible protein OsmC
MKMKTTNTASASYQGLGKTGKGHISTGSGAFSAQPYGFQTRFEDKAGTNPEELIAAAHAACFTMALSFKLAEAGFEDGSVATSAEVTLEKDDSGFKITRSALSTKGKVAGLAKEKFEALAQEAKTGCPISRLLDTEITLDIKFEG